MEEKDFPVEQHDPVREHIEPPPGAPKQTAIDLDLLSITSLIRLLNVVLADASNDDGKTITIEKGRIQPIVKSLFDKSIAKPCSYQDCPLWNENNTRRKASAIIDSLDNLSKSAFALIDPYEVDTLKALLAQAGGVQDV